MAVKSETILVLTAGAVLLCAVTGCSRARSGQRQGDLSGATVDVPQFAIAVKLSPAAESQLRSMHESVKVIAYFDGDPLPGQGTYGPPMRDVYLGMDEKEVDEKNVAIFDHARVALRDWNRLADKNYYVTINTVSARKAYSNNLLDCDEPDFERRIESFKGRTIKVPCRLIGEAKATTYK